MNPGQQELKRVIKLFHKHNGELSCCLEYFRSLSMSELANLTLLWYDLVELNNRGELEKWS